MNAMRDFVGSQEELEAYLKFLHIRARQIVSNPLVWVRIQAVANALIERSELTATELGDTILSAFRSTIYRGYAGYNECPAQAEFGPVRYEN